MTGGRENEKAGFVFLSELQSTSSTSLRDKHEVVVLLGQ